jgi:hypothetical protein
MRVRSFIIAVGSAAALAACGGTPTPSRPSPLRWVLTNDAERLEFEPQSVLTELFNEASRISRVEGSSPTRSAAPFLIIQDGQSLVAPGFDAHADLLQPPDGGVPVELSFGDRGDGRWPEDRRAALGGLSEREAAEQVARSLLSLWGIQSSSVLVMRAPNAPFAAALSDDDTLRLNPAFLYMAAAASGISSRPTEVQ